MFGMQGARGRVVRGVRLAGVHVSFYNYLRRNKQGNENLLRQLHSKTDAGLGRTKKVTTQGILGFATLL